MTDFREKAVENLAVRSEEDGLWQCQVCGKSLKTEGGIKSHILKVHGNVVEEKARALEKEHLVSSLTYYKELMRGWYRDVSEEYEEVKKEFLGEAGENLLSALEWKTEKVVKETVRWQEATRLYRKILEDVIDSEEVDWKAVKEVLEEIIEEERGKLLQNPPSHRSTSEMDFLLEVWGYEAKCSFWSGSHWKEGACSLLFFVKKLVEYREKLEMMEKTEA